MNLKLVLKRGALLAAANWPAIVIQFIAETTFQVLLAVPIIGAAILVAVLAGADLAELLQGSLRDIFTTIAGTLMSVPVALVAFMIAFSIVLLGGSMLMFLVKGGTVEVLLAAERSTGPVEREPITFERALRPAFAFTLPRFMDGCRRLFRRYLALGVWLMLAYVASASAYLAFVVYGYRAAGGRLLAMGWTVVAAVPATLALVAWITAINWVYLLLQIVMAAENCGLVDAVRGLVRFARSEARLLAGIFAVILALVIAATLASALAWSGVGLIAFVPLVGLAVFPLQIAALLLRGLVFEYIGLAALAAYASLYLRQSEYEGRRAPVRTGPGSGRPPVAVA